jgi:hypothetical protein
MQKIIQHRKHKIRHKNLYRKRESRDDNEYQTILLKSLQDQVEYQRDQNDTTIMSHMIHYCHDTMIS